MEYGPKDAVAMVKPWGVLRVLVSHQWDVAGEDDYDTSITGGNETTFPLGVGVSKTTFMVGRPYKFGLQFWHYVESPDNFGPDYQLRFTVSPVVKLPW